MKQKHFMDIQNIREEDTDLRQNNVFGFEVGDIIQISEKIDGSNACVAYDSETDSLVCFSRRQTLDFQTNLSGFWNYVQTLDKTEFKLHPSWKVFGEWSGARNKLIYDERFKKKWIIYDIYDMEVAQYLPQDVVKAFCKTTGLEYIKVFYEGPFISWEHCKSFLNSPQYGEKQEGIVVKNISKLSNDEDTTPFYLKIVNDDFKETMKTRVRVIDPEKEKAKDDAQTLVESIVTPNRVEKELFKMRDEGLVPDKLTAQDMSLVARLLPKRIFEDCMKEEREIVLACGEHFGKACSSTTMKYARNIILGGKA